MLTFFHTPQAKINQDLKQYKVRINVPDYGPQVLHFAHHPSSNSTAIPLLFVQGWPGSFLEARKIINSLTTPSSPNTQAFHVVVPSIPGFGPGDAPKKSGFGPITTAKAFKVLMVDVLGYDRFVTQGGDWGAFITRSLAVQYPQHVKAYHCNLIPCGPPAWYKAPWTMGRLILNSYLYTKREKQGIENMQHYAKEGSGYFKQQSTRPQSLGFGLGDSPTGLLAWFVEKLHEWMDVAHYTMPDDEILTFVMMHWYVSSDFTWPSLDHTPSFETCFGSTYFPDIFQDSMPPLTCKTDSRLITQDARCYARSTILQSCEPRSRTHASEQLLSERDVDDLPRNAVRSQQLPSRDRHPTLGLDAGDCECQISQGTRRRRALSLCRMSRRAGRRPEGMVRRRCGQVCSRSLRDDRVGRKLVMRTKT